MTTFLVIVFIAVAIYILTRDTTPVRPVEPVAPPSKSRPGQGRPQESEPVGKHQWIAPGVSVTVAGYVIPEGMIYVGNGLKAANGWDIEPALINPKLQVAQHSTDHSATTLQYWPSYSSISASSRATYLRWLSEGRCDPQIDIGYVFLFFYGLERRLLADAQNNEVSADEAAVLISEIRRLLSIYGGNSSFQGYASRLLDFARATQTGFDTIQDPATIERAGWELPFTVKLAVGKFVADEKPIPAEWALAWFRLDQRLGLKTSGKRCPEEFADLFVIRYRERFGEGMLLKRNKTNLRSTYHPASASLQGLAISVDTSLPDVTELQGPIKRLQKFGEEVQLELDRFSRWVGKTGDRTSLAAIALLPSAIAEKHLSGDSARLVTHVRATLDRGIPTTFPTAELIRNWPLKEPGKVSKAEATAISELLGHFGIGFEPDIAFGSPNLSKTNDVVIFRSPQERKPTQSPAFAAAKVLVQLAASVAAVDKNVSDAEQEHIERHLEAALQLAHGERERLRAFFRWSIQDPPSLSGLKARLAQLSAAQRSTAGRFLIAVAGADGNVSAAEMKVLTRIYDLLEANPQQLYEDLQSLATGADRGPVTLIPAEAKAGGYRIPKPSGQETPIRGAIALDPARIRAVIEDTTEVAGVLTAIFAESDPEAAQTDDTPGLGEAATEGDAMPSQSMLDDVHLQFACALVERTTWNRADVEQLARARGLLIAGAIEVLNEAAFAACDEPLLEGDDPIEINRYAFEEMTV